MWLKPDNRNQDPEQDPVRRPREQIQDEDVPLTQAAGSQFTDSHAGLTVNLLNAAEQTFGEEGVKRIISRCAEQQIETCRSRVPLRGSLQNRLKALVTLRNEEGFFPSLEQCSKAPFC